MGVMSCPLQRGIGSKGDQFEGEGELSRRLFKVQEFAFDGLVDRNVSQRVVGRNV
jgi:hypothetical protein